MIKICTIVNGYLKENCYIVHNDINALIIDPGSEGERIIDEVEKLKLNVVAILITHHHFDHVGALEEVKKHFNIDLVIDCKNKINKVADFSFEIIENFGHTLDSVSYYFKEDNVMFTGDFVFKETIGIYNNKHENFMINSLRRFKKLDKSIQIYPGHGEKSTVGNEIENNMFLRGI